MTPVDIADGCVLLNYNEEEPRGVKYEGEDEADEQTEETDDADDAADDADADDRMHRSPARAKGPLTKHPPAPARQ